MSSLKGGVEKLVSSVRVLVIGNDAVLAALPAHPIQLAHACYLNGYALVVPASWGDELVAEYVVRALDGRGRQPAIVCSCAFVRERLLSSGSELAPFLIESVAPPVAVARYLRAMHVGPKLHLTYAGSCPAGKDRVYDDCLEPHALLTQISDAGIDVSEQPLLFDDIVPPDRRRHFSLPGGCPSPEALWQRQTKWRLVEAEGPDLALDLAERLMGHEPIVVDVSAGLGCRCTGAGGATAASARLAVMSLEPPRSPLPVLEPLHGPIRLVREEAGRSLAAVEPAAPLDRDEPAPPATTLPAGRAWPLVESADLQSAAAGGASSTAESAGHELRPTVVEDTEIRPAEREAMVLVPPAFTPVARRPFATTPPHALRAVRAIHHAARRRRSAREAQVDMTAVSASSDVAAPLPTPLTRSDAERAIPVTTEGAPEPRDMTLPGLGAAPTAPERLRGVATADAAAGRSAVTPVSAGSRQQQEIASPSRPTPRAVRAPGARLTGQERRVAHAQTGSASAPTRIRDFLWMLMSFLAGAAAAVGAWSAWFRQD